MLTAIDIEKIRTGSNSLAILLSEAQAMDIAVSIVPGSDVYRLSFRGRTEYLSRQWTSQLSYLGGYAAMYKDVAKVFLAKAHLSVCPGMRCLSYADAETFARIHGFPLVLKPVQGVHGTDVIVGITNTATLEAGYEQIQKSGKPVLVETQFVPGAKEYRLFATRTRFLAAMERRPANVVGDGVQTIRALVEEKNRLQNRVDDYSAPLLKLHLDATELGVLHETGLTPEHIPAVGTRVFLRHNSNISTGGDSIDCTDEVHESVKELAVRAVQAIPGFPYGGVDFLTLDMQATQTSETYAIIEMNHSPGLDLHHFPAEGTQRNVSRALLEELFGLLSVS